MVDIVAPAVIHWARDPGSSDMTMPKYQRVADAIRGKIRNGTYPPGAAIPSTNALLLEYRVGYGTLRTAIRQLKDEGLIYGQQGEAVYVADPLPPERPKPEENSD